MSPVDFKEMAMSPVAIFDFFLSILNSPLSPVDFKNWHCPLSLFRNNVLSIFKKSYVAWRIKEMIMFRNNFKRNIKKIDFSV